MKLQKRPQKAHWLLPWTAERLSSFRQYTGQVAYTPDRSAINLGLWLWPFVQLIVSWTVLSKLSKPLLAIPQLTFVYDLFFLLLLGLWLLNFFALLQLSRGKASGFALFYWSALPTLPFSLIALYSLSLLAHSKQKSRNFNETIVYRYLTTIALSVVFALGLLIFFIVFRGLFAMPLIAEQSELGPWQRLLQQVQSWRFFFNYNSLSDFLFSTKWAPSESPPHYGIFGFIWGSVVITLLALLISVPIGVAAAIYIAEFAPKRISRLLRNASELLAGLPSVVFGFFGSILVVPLVRNLLPSEMNTGFNAISGGIILAFMILPTIINISEVSLRSVSQTLRAGSLALGATKWQTTAKITVPAAVSGILTSIVLGACRAIGETLAVLMVAGNAIHFALLPVQPTRTLTMNIIAEMAYAQDDPSSGSYHLTSLFTTSIVLMLFIFSLNLLLGLARKRIQKRFNPS